MTTPTTPEEIAAPLAVEMTILTGEIWRVATSQNGNPQIVSTSACLTLSQAWNQRGRVQLRASVPPAIRQKKSGQEITCSLSRPVENIARDIIARLLQHAREHLAESTAYDLEKRKEEAAEKLRENLIKPFAPKLHNGKFYNPGSKKNSRSTLWVEIYDYCNEAEIKIRLPLRKALQLLKTIRNGKYIQ